MIDWNTGRWDADIVKEIFHPLGAELILQMRIGGLLIDDELIWHHEKNDMFFVRSAYHRWMEHTYVSQAGKSSHPNQMNKLWRKL